MDVLNRRLYRRLGERFGNVKVSNQGQAMACQPGHDFDGKPVLFIGHPGEYYQVCCPFCRDTRHRLYVNHRFGQADSTGRRLLFLAICYNENCLSRSDNLTDFVDRLDSEFIAEAVVKKGVDVPEELREVLPPGPTIPVGRLRRTHPARVYLQSRGFDPDELDAKFGVTYCTGSRYSFARDRLIFSVYERGLLKGWQARYVGELDWKGEKKRELPPKYFNTPDAHFKSKVIFNWDRMRQWQTGVVVEGPMDVFRFGSMAGCIFGNSMSPEQRKKFLAVFRKRTGVLLLDPEEFESKSTLATVSYMQKEMPGRFCAVRLPAGTDPGSLGREFLRAFVKQEAAAQGVKVVYRKVA